MGSSEAVDRGERVATLAGIAELDVVRHLLRAGATPLERTEVWAALARAAAVNADRAAVTAVEEGASFARVGRALGLSRQATRRRYGPGQAA